MRCCLAFLPGKAIACCPAQAATFASDITILTDIFLRLIKMIIAPLVFTTLVVGIAKMGDTRTVGASAPRLWAGSCWPP